MRTVSYRLGDMARATINIGKVAENEYTRVQFNAEQIFAEYPAATPSMAVISPEGVKYPAVVTREGDLIIWDVTDADLTAEGMDVLTEDFCDSIADAPLDAYGSSIFGSTFANDRLAMSCLGPTMSYDNLRLTCISVDMSLR